MMRSTVIYIEIQLLSLILFWAKGQPIEVISKSSEKLERNDYSASTKLPEIIYTTTSLSRLYENNDQRGKKYQRFGDASKFDFTRGVIGIADIDYPAYSVIPETSFSCHGKLSGYYADEETRCQVFHVCYSTSTIKQSFLCPNGTVFSQELTTCEWWTKVNCDESKRNYFSDKYDHDLQVSQSVTHTVTLPRTTESSLTGSKINNKTSNENHNNNNRNDLKIIHKNINNNGTKERVFEDVELNITNHKSDDIQLILDNLFADFQDNKGTKPIKYTEDYILQKMYNTNLSVKYENQKNLKDINNTIDYSFLLYDSMYSGNRTTTVPVDSITSGLKYIYNYENITNIETQDHDLLKNLKIDENLQNKTTNLLELLNLSKSLNSTIVRTHKNSNRNNEEKSTKNRSTEDFKSTELPFVSELMQYSKISTSNHDNEDENHDESDEVYDESLDKTTYSILDLLRNTEKTIYETSPSSKSESKEKIIRREPDKLLLEFLSSNDNHTEEILNSQLLAEFHTISKNTNLRNSSNEKVLKNNTIYLNATSKERNTSKSENQIKRNQRAKTIVEKNRQQSYNIPSLNLTNIQDRKLQNFIQDQTINTFFKNNNPPRHHFLNLFDLNESGNKNVNINTTPIIFRSEEKEIQITPKPPYKTTTLSNSFSTNKYSLNMDDLLSINTGFDNPIHQTQFTYKDNPQIHSLLEEFDASTITNIQNGNNYFINDSNNGLLKRDKPALTLADIFNINKLQSFYNLKNSHSQLFNTEKNIDSTEPEFIPDKQEIYNRVPQTPETVIYRSLGFSFDTEDEVKAFGDAISAGLISET